MPLSILKELILKVARENPALVLLTITVSLSVGVAVFSYAYTRFALKVDVEDQFKAAKEETKVVVENLAKEVGDVSNQVTALSQQTKRLDCNTQQRGLESIIRNINSEIFQLERLVQSGEANQRDIHRLDRLRSDLDERKRELQGLAC